MSIGGSGRSPPAIRTIGSGAAGPTGFAPRTNFSRGLGKALIAQTSVGFIDYDDELSGPSLLGRDDRLPNCGGSLITQPGQQGSRPKLLIVEEVDLPRLKERPIPVLVDLNELIRRKAVGDVLDAPQRLEVQFGQVRQPEECQLRINSLLRLGTFLIAGQEGFDHGRHHDRLARACRRGELNPLRRPQQAQPATRLIDRRQETENGCRLVVARSQSHLSLLSAV